MHIIKVDAITLIFIMPLNMEIRYAKLFEDSKSMFKS